MRLIDANALLEAIYKIYGANHAPQGIINLITNAPTVHEGWVSVETEPPMIDAGESDWKYKTSGELLIYSPTAGIQKAVLEYSDKFKQWRFATDDDIYEIDDVTHWQPIPAAPTDKE